MIDLDGLEFFESSSKYGVVKATVHKTGKLGFSSGAKKFMKLEDVDYFNIGTNKNDPEDHNLYLIPIEKETDRSFKVVKAGDYYYVTIKNVLRDLKIDYKKETVIFDIDEEEINGLRIFKLIRRGQK